MKEDTAFKSATEIQSLASKLTPANQFQMINTINTLLFCQSLDKKKPVQPGNCSKDKSL